jgi:hypothetical protein
LRANLTRLNSDREVENQGRQGKKLSFRKIKIGYFFQLNSILQVEIQNSTD